MVSLTDSLCLTPVWRPHPSELTFLVLVRLGCYNKTPQTGWLINNRNLFVTVLEAGKSRSRHQHG